MKLDELILKLAELRGKYGGDVEVYNKWLVIENITYHEQNNSININ